MNEIFSGGAAVSAIIGLATVATNAGLPTRFAPILDIVLGIGAAAGIVYVATPGIAITQGIVEAVGIGVSLGLTAGGVYDKAKDVSGYIQLKRAPTPPPAPIIIPASGTPGATV